MQVHTACPLAESLPNGHAVHAALPFTVLNVPAAHAVHVTSPPGPVYPGTHAHALLALLPAADCVRFGHTVQLCAPEPENVSAGHGAHPVEPFAAAKLPAPHSAHASLLVVFLYFPTAHAAHGPSAGPVYPELHKQPEEQVPGGKPLYTSASYK